MQTALEKTTLGYWQVMRSLRAPNTDLAFNVGRLHVMRSCASQNIKRLATEELHRLDRAFQQQIENEGECSVNIREHIEAGHYPRDEKGRALVPTREGGTAIILATDLGGIMGAMQLGGLRDWDVHGNWRHHDASPKDLLPPPPRKVKVTAWAIIGPHGFVLRFSDHRPSGVATGIERLVELTGEYEQEW